jgi:DNA-3-methyladenine glycosylase II
MAGLIDGLGELPILTPKPSSFYFTALCQSIVSQQLSTRVADVITERVMAHFGTEELDPVAVFKAVPDELRALGLSWAKIKYMQDLADHTANQGLPLVGLDQLEEAEIIEALTKVKGIGQWTVEMFMMFTLGRPDVFSSGDLGLRRAMERWYALAADAKPIALSELAEQWAPYRTYASMVLWRSLDTPKIVSSS